MQSILKKIVRGLAMRYGMFPSFIASSVNRHFSSCTLIGNDGSIAMVTQNFDILNFVGRGYHKSPAILDRANAS